MFYRDKTVLITGCTGFKGSWLCKILSDIGAKVIGYSLDTPTNPCLFNIIKMNSKIISIRGDVRNLQRLREVFRKYQPEIVFHLAAQPIVRTSYKDPVLTYETNVMGTVNLLECIRENECVKSVVNITTDKVYKNNEWEWGYREIDPLDGYDPYSNSKSCSELVTHSYNCSFFQHRDVAVSTSRAGNVIGGGDFACDRIIVDCVKAAASGEKIIVRNPLSTRPYQHVLEPLFGYMLIAEKQYYDKKCAGYYNIGPDDVDCITTGYLVDTFCKIWGNGVEWVNENDNGPHEAGMLKLDCSKMKTVFGWKPRWKFNDAIINTIDWYKDFYCGNDVEKTMKKQIEEFINKER